MKDFLGDPAVGVIVAIIFGVAGLAASIVAYRASRRIKSLRYGVLPATSVVTVHEEAKDSVQVTFNGVPVTDAQLVRVFIANTGNVPVSDGDFRSPLKILFGAGTRILTAAVVKTFPSGMPARVHPDGEDLRLEPLLLNNGDWLEVDVLVTNYGGGVQVDGRISGVTRVTEFNANTLILDPARMPTPGSLLQLLSLISLVVFTYLITVSDLPWHARLALFLLLGATTVLGLSVYEKKPSQP